QTRFDQIIDVDDFDILTRIRVAKRLAADASEAIDSNPHDRTACKMAARRHRAGARQPLTAAGSRRTKPDPTHEHERQRACSAPRDHALARRAAMIFTNDLPRFSSNDSPVASASCSVTAPHAMPRKK